jgi:hypothetical protein
VVVARRGLLVVVAGGGLVLVGCAATSTPTAAAGSAVFSSRAVAGKPGTAAALQSPRDFDASPPPAVVLPEVSRPRTPAEAGALVGEALGCLQRGDKQGAVPRLVALLRSDFLSERGRANLYWLLAEAADGVDDERRRDALGGYLVAASVLDTEPEVRERMARARAWLVASDVRMLALGTSPERAIDVASRGEADVVVAALPCGQRGGRYVDRGGVVDRARDKSLTPRRLLCTETGDELTLWFRLPRAPER